MNGITKQDIQRELQSQLENNWVLSKLDLEVIDAKGQAHLFDVALHTGEFVFGRITIGPLSRARLDGVTEKRCLRIEDIHGCVRWAATLQEIHCRNNAIRPSHYCAAMA
jgi:hypothetical protein